MRLIDADELERFIQDGLNNPDKNKAFGSDAIEILGKIFTMSTADVKKFVLCSNCKYAEHDNKNFAYCYKIHVAVPNDFGCVCGAIMDMEKEGSK